MTGFRPAPEGLAAVAAVAVVALLTVGCSDGADESAPTPTSAGPPQVYVAIGSDETVGTGSERPLLEAWPRVLFRTALDQSTVFVNAATEGSTVAQALDEQLPVANELQPTLVTVWVNRWDVVAGVPVEAYERQLADLVRALRRGGETQVLVANVPPLPAGGASVALGPASPDDDLSFTEVPAATPQEVAARTAAYNDAIARVAASEGATLVDLHGAADAASLFTADGVGLTPEGHARVAELFAEALRPGGSDTD
jgi:lysophospholipase L1-like esterase